MLNDVNVHAQVIRDALGPLGVIVDVVIALHVATYIFMVSTMDTTTLISPMADVWVNFGMIVNGSMHALRLRLYN